MKKLTMYNYYIQIVVIFKIIAGIDILVKDNYERILDAKWILVKVQIVSINIKDESVAVYKYLRQTVRSGFISDYVYSIALKLPDRFA